MSDAWLTSMRAWFRFSSIAVSLSSSAAIGMRRAISGCANVAAGLPRNFSASTLEVLVPSRAPCLGFGARCCLPCRFFSKVREAPILFFTILYLVF